MNDKILFLFSFLFVLIAIVLMDSEMAFNCFFTAYLVCFAMGCAVLAKK